MFFLPFLSFFGWGWFYKKPHKCKCEVTPQNLRLYWPSSSSPASPKFAVLDFILTQFSGGPCAQDRYPFIGNTQREGEKTNKKRTFTSLWISVTLIRKGGDVWMAADRPISSGISRTATRTCLEVAWVVTTAWPNLPKLAQSEHKGGFTIFDKT